MEEEIISIISQILKNITKKNSLPQLQQEKQPQISKRKRLEWV